VRGALVSRAQGITHLAEWRKFPPTHSYAAGPGHSVALTYALHPRSDGLRKQRKFQNVVNHLRNTLQSILISPLIFWLAYLSLKMRILTYLSCACRQPVCVHM
jgi:hypothetical protein